MRTHPARTLGSGRLANGVLSTAFLYVVALLCTLLAGPPLLLLLLLIYPFDWDPLSVVGQSYTGVSALLSALALIAVAASIRFQAKEVQISRTLAVHESQRELIRMALEDPTLLPCVNATDDIAGRQRLYNTLWLRYYELAFATGSIDSDALVDLLERERFVVPAVREHWRRVAGLWTNLGQAEFVSVVERAYRAAVDASGQGDTTQPGRSPGTVQPPQPEETS